MLAGRMGIRYFGDVLRHRITRRAISNRYLLQRRSESQGCVL
jgi:hypothetical protein